MSSFIRIARRTFALALVGMGLVTAAGAQAHAEGGGCLPASIKAKLGEIRQKFGPVSIVSAHRPGARIAGSGKRSYHASCRAVDFNPPKGKYAQVVAWLKANHSGGVGTYSCGMHHIHIDNGPRVRFHHCVTASGRPTGKSKYAANGSKKRYSGKGSSKKQYASKKSGTASAAVKSSAPANSRVSARHNPFVGG